MISKYSHVGILLTMLALITQVELRCYDLVKQYYECQNLTMTKMNYSMNQVYYYPNYSIPNNKLNDSFYQRLGLENMTFNRAMDLFRLIHTRTNNCTTEFCNCVSFHHIDTSNSYFSIYFRNETNFLQFRDIVASFINKFRNFMYSLNSTQLRLSYSYEHPTLSRFCMTNEYTTQRLRYYNYSLMSCVYRNYSV